MTDATVEVATIASDEVEAACHGFDEVGRQVEALHGRCDDVRLALAAVTTAVNPLRAAQVPARSTLWREETHVRA